MTVKICSLNPYSNGTMYLIKRDKDRKGRVMRLNPYSNGTMYLIGKKEEKLLIEACLNPYSNGTMYLIFACGRVRGYVARS